MPTTEEYREFLKGQPYVVLAIVGSQLSAWKDPELDETRVRQLCRVAIDLLHPDVIISGRSPSGGVDIWAEKEANRKGYTVENGGFRAYVATVPRWEGEGGFKARDIDIAEACTHILAIRSMWARTYGSGYTHDRAQALGRVCCMMQI